MRALKISNADGSLGQCTAKCYDAPPKTRCRCICGGRNHGVGEPQALANALEIRSEFPTAKVEIDDRANQTHLWPDDRPKLFPPRNAKR